MPANLTSNALDRTATAASALRSEAIATSGDPQSKIAQRYAFEALVRSWKIAEIGPDLDDTKDEQDAWSSLEECVRRREKARSILQFPTPSGHLCCLRDKLDILAHYASDLGADMGVVERILINGIMALRADIVNHGG